MSTILGIDNGLSGALAFIVEGFEPEIIPMPTLTLHTSPFKKKQTVYDLPKIKHLILKAKPTCVIVERAYSMPNQSCVATFTTGMNYGLIRGLLMGLDCITNIVSPKIWQHLMLADCEEKDTKKASIEVAKLLYPDVSLRRTSKCRTDSHGMADALNLAEYGRRALAENPNQEKPA